MIGSPQIEREIDTLLQESRTATVATVDDHGQPHAANVQYVHDEQRRFYFVSDHQSAHSRHIARTGKVALTIYAHDDHRPDQIHGLQLHGSAQVLTDPEDRRRARDLYMRKYNFIATNADLQRAVDAQQFYRVTPSWIRWIDNRCGFGFKVEGEAEATKRRSDKATKGAE